MSRADFLSRLMLAESACRDGDFETAAEHLPDEDAVSRFPEDDPLVNRFWVVHAVATDRPEEYCS